MTSVEPSNCRILVVDDNPCIHDDFRKILCPEPSQRGAAVISMVEEIFGEAPQKRSHAIFEMESAYQGAEALDKVRLAEQEGHPYSMAFMDVRMPPGWDGVETIKQIWKEFPHIQVVICTAYSDYSWDQILDHLGGTDNLVILKKPFDNVEVLQLAHTLTKKWSVTRKANARMAELDERVRVRTHELVEANQQLKNEIQRRSLIESALRESEERFHNAFETVSVALSIQPINTGRYFDVNQSFEFLCGYNKGELLGKSPEELGILEAPGRYREYLERIRNKKQVRNVDLNIRRRSGEIRQAVASIEVLRLGEQTCLLTALQDVTEQKKLESTLRQTQKMEAVGQLAAGVAHDFNNLMTVIQGYSSLLLEINTLDADVAEAVTEIEKASERAAALTRELLAFTRQQIVQLRPIDLGKAIVGMRNLLHRSLGETVELEYRLSPNLPRVLADASSIDQVLLNLVINARDSMPKGGKVVLSTDLATLSEVQAAMIPQELAGTFVRLSVTDCGCGMDRDTLNHIFEPFFTTKAVGQGTGLGLSTVYGIVKQHKGWIDVESQRGMGTTFRVFLPIADQPLA